MNIPLILVPASLPMSLILAPVSEEAILVAAADTEALAMVAFAANGLELLSMATGCSMGVSTAKCP